MKRIRVAMILVAGWMMSAGCATGSKGTTESKVSQKVENSAVAAVPEEVRSFIYHPRAPVVMRFRLEDWEPVGRFVGKLKAAVVGQDQPMPQVDRLVADGPLGVIGDMYRKPGGDGAGIRSLLDENRGAYLTYVADARPGLYRASTYGLAWLPSADLTRAVGTRVLLPTQEPGKLAEALRKHVRPPHGAAMAVEPGERYVRVRVAWGASGLEIDSEAALERLAGLADTGSSSLAEPTPALVSCLGAEAPVAVYLDAGRFRDYRAASAAFYIADTDTDAPARRQQAFARGASTLLNMGVALGDAQREQVDFCTSLRATPAGDVSARLTRSRTRLGREIAEAAETSVELPAFSANALPASKSAVELSWVHDLAAVAKQHPTSIRPDSETSMLEGRFPLRQLRTTARMVTRSLGASLLVGPVVNPHLPVRLVAEGLSEESLGYLPVAGGLRVMPANSGSTPSGFKAAGVIVLEGGDGVSVEVLRRILKNAGRRMPWAFDFDVARRESKRVVVRLAANLAIEDAFDDETVTVEGIDAAVRPAKVATILKDTPVGRRLRLNVAELAELGTIELARGSGETADRLELNWGGGSAEVGGVPETGFEPPTVAPDCVDRLKISFIDAFVKLADLGPEATEKQMRELVAGYRATAKTCMEAAPERREDLEFARGRALWFAAQKFVMFTIEERPRLQKECEEQGPESAACERLGEIPPEEFNRTLKTVRSLYGEACELGDEVACEAKTNLPEPLETTE